MGYLSGLAREGKTYPCCNPFSGFLSQPKISLALRKKIIINKKQQKSTTSQPKIVLGLSVLTTRLKKEVSDVREKRAERKLFMKERYLDPENKLLNALFINHQHSGVYIYMTY